MYIPANNAGFPMVAAEDWQPSAQGFQIGLDQAATAMPAIPEVREAALAGTTGSLVAWDPVARKEKWRVDFEGPWNGGILSTAGNLVLQGNAKESFVAYAADTGRQLWSFPAQTGIIAAPMTYAIDGEQYVAILAGWGGVWDIAPGIMASKSGRPRNISRLLVFKLGGTAKLPPAPPYPALVLDPPAFTGTAAQVARGGALYGRYCGVCHGDAAVSGTLNPDLRHSPAIGSADAVRSVVIDGALEHKGMVSFSEVVKPEDAEAIRQYVLKRANEDKALENRTVAHPVPRPPA
jgi:alcohol dehydrogenase (cytochrome c)/quinohemoprotein ethanol dehydrogenase